MSQLERFLEAATAKTGRSARRSGDGFITCCPAHEDDRESLSVKEGDDGRVLVRCFAGCKAESIMDSIGQQLRDLFPPKSGGGRKRRGRFVCAYDYVDSGGVLLYQNVRFADPKDFLQRRPNPEQPSEWIWNLKGVERVLWQLPQVLEGVKKRRPIVVVEGEKDVRSIEGAGWPVVATTKSGGARAKWLPSFSEALRGADVIVIPDNDKPGREGALDTARALHGIARSVTILELPNLKEHGDVTDWMQNCGGNWETFFSLLRESEAFDPEKRTDGQGPMLPAPEAGEIPPELGGEGPATRSPPSNVELERVVIGTLLERADAWDMIRDAGLEARDLYDLGHRQILEALGCLADAGQPFDDQLILSQVKGTRVEVTRLQGLRNEAHGSPETVLAQYIRLLKQAACQREIITRSEEVREAAYSDPGKLHAAMAEIECLRAMYGEVAGLVEREAEIMGGRDFAEADFGPPPKAFWGRQILEQDRVFVGAVPKIGKSMFALNLALAIAGGLAKFLGHAVTQGRVMYLGREVRNSLFQMRYRKMLEHEATLRLDVLQEYLFLMPECYRNFSTQSNRSQDQQRVENDRKWLERQIGVYRPDLLIIDPWYMFFPNDEKSIEMIQPALDYLDRLQQKYLFAIMLFHHERKTQGKESILQRLSGNMVIGRWADTIMGMDWPDKAAEEARSHVRMEIVGRNVELPRTIWRRFNDSCFWFSPEEDYRPVVGQKERLKLTPVVDALRAGPINHAALWKALVDSEGISERTAKRWIAQAASTRHQLVLVSDDKVYTINPMKDGKDEGDGDD